jgi:hypothetical protein
LPRNHIYNPKGKPTTTTTTTSSGTGSAAAKNSHPDLPAI